MEITLPSNALVVLVGPSGSGKSTFASKHFKTTEVVSSDRCRGLISDDEADWSINQDAFDIVFLIARKRLALGRLTVIDATSLRPCDRKPLLNIADEYERPAVAIVFDLPPELCHARNTAKPDRQFGLEVCERHSSMLRESLEGIKGEGFAMVTVFRSEAEVNSTTIERLHQATERQASRNL